MKTVLLGWELGANLGHAMPLAAIARRLAGDGVRIVVAARDLQSARLAFEGQTVELVQAPVWPAHRHFGSETGQASYLDILAQIGFAEPAKLGAVVAAWLALIDLIAPDAIVADHAPGLLVAARLRAIAVLQVGSGFTMPPADFDRLPPIRADRAPVMPEKRALVAVAAVAAEHGGQAPGALVALFRTAARVVFGCPELDPYAPFRREPLHLPPEPLPGFVAAPVVPRLFVYLGPEIPRLDTLVQVLSELGVEIEAYLRGDAGPIARFLSLAGHRVHEQPPPLADVLPNCSHVLSAGGAFTSHACLAAGRPMLAIAQHGEAEINAQMLNRLGAGGRLARWDNDAQLKTSLLAFLRNHALLPRAIHWAKVLEARKQPDGGAAAARIVRTLVEGSQAASPLAEKASLTPSQ